MDAWHYAAIKQQLEKLEFIQKQALQVQNAPQTDRIRQLE